MPAPRDEAGAKSSPGSPNRNSVLYPQATEIARLIVPHSFGCLPAPPFRRHFVAYLSGAFSNDALQPGEQK
jgi:hypothetical protein